MLRPLLLIVLTTVFATSALAAPISLKELDLLIRMRVPEPEILRELEQRKLLNPVDAAAEQSFQKNGASAALMQRLKTGNYVVSNREAATIEQHQAERQLSLAREKESDAAALAELEQQHRRGTAPVSDTMRNLLNGKLVRMENGDLRSYSADELRNVRYYAFYYSAHWCGPCRQFTPRLVEFYKRFKAQHPDFEIIFVSNDYNPAGMQTYMKSFGMPWPAVRFEQIDPKMRSMAGQGIPWLGIFNAAGEPISDNGRTKQWVDPSIVLRSFEQSLTQTASR